MGIFANEETAVLSAADGGNITVRTGPDTLRVNAGNDVLAIKGGTVYMGSQMLTPDALKAAGINPQHLVDLGKDIANIPLVLMPMHKSW